MNLKNQGGNDDQSTDKKIVISPQLNLDDSIFNGSNVP